MCACHAYSHCHQTTADHHSSPVDWWVETIRVWSALVYRRWPTLLQSTFTIFTKYELILEESVEIPCSYLWRLSQINPDISQVIFKFCPKASVLNHLTIYKLIRRTFAFTWLIGSNFNCRSVFYILGACPESKP